MTQPSDLSDYSMFNLFGMEVESQTHILTENLLSLEKQLQSSQESPSHQSLPILESLMRASHSIKGAARIVQIDIAVRIAHAMEDCFVAAMDRIITLTPEKIDFLLQGVDFLLAISKVDENNLDTWLSEQQSYAETIVAAIASLLNRRKSDRTSSSPLRDESKVINNIIEKSLESAEIAPENGENNQLSLDDIFPEIDEPELELASGFIASEATVLDIAPLSSPLSSSVTATPFDSKSSSFTEEDAEASLSEVSFVSPSAIYSNSSKEHFVRVNADLLNRLMGLAGESLVEATTLAPLADSFLSLKRQQLDLSKLIEKLLTILEKFGNQNEIEVIIASIQQKERECRAILSDRLSALEQFSHRSYNLADSLYREVIATRMRPFEEGIQGFSRMVRDLAKKLNKKVKLEILGQTTLIDRDILSKLESPLTHILQNAIDHGIELPEEREKKGKPPEGTILLEVTYRFGMLSITITDDGRGIRLEKLRQSIIDKGLVTEEMAKRLNDAELMEFIFLPSFSTASQVTDISGRGIGLNVAKTMVKEVGGSLQAFSNPEQGITFHFQLPLTLSVIRTLLVEISGEPYAFPLSRVEHIFTLAYDAIYSSENRQYCIFNEQNIGLIRADQILELDTSYIAPDKLSIVILSETFNQYGVIVDRFLGERNLVIRPLDPRLGKIQDISAAAILEDGAPVLIIDVADLIRSIDKILNNGQLSRIEPTIEHSWHKNQKSILVIDDSITVREMERKILQNHGYQVDIAVDGMEGWNCLQRGDYDLVISDVDMPRLSGIKLVELIKQHSHLSQTPVIIVSYKDREEDRLKGLEAGADYYLTKSRFHDDTLVNVVRDLIGKR